nr:hypothetical protein Itr_chr12CG14860 [Ipomoea trifida]
MAIGESLRFDVAIMVGGCLRSFYGSRSVQRSPVEAAFSVGEDGCSAVVAVAEEREAFGVGSRKWRVARGGGCSLAPTALPDFPPPFLRPESGTVAEKRVSSSDMSNSGALAETR